MDLSCIISSGDLELYVLGMLDNEESSKITQLALLFQEVDDEINRIRETLRVLSLKAEIEPAPHVREKVINAIRALKEDDNQKGAIPLISTTQSNVHKQTPDAAVNNEQGKTVSLGRNQHRNQYLLAASLIALVVSIASIVHLNNRNDQYRQEVASIQKQVQSLNKDGQQSQGLLQYYEHAIAVAQDTATLKLQLQPVPGKPPALAQVYWNKNTHEVMVSNISLPAVPQGKQYQLWAIVNGKPVDAGVIRNDNKPMQKMKDFDQAQAFAITMEKEGGSPTPTMEAMYVMAKV